MSTRGSTEAEDTMQPETDTQTVARVLRRAGITAAALALTFGTAAPAFAGHGDATHTDHQKSDQQKSDHQKSSDHRSTAHSQQADATDNDADTDADDGGA